MTAPARSEPGVQAAAAKIVERAGPSAGRRGGQRATGERSHHGDSAPGSRGWDSSARARMKWFCLDSANLTWRNLVAFTRVPEALFFSTIQPVMLVFLFRYVFGGMFTMNPAMQGFDYVNFMMPGIFVQTVAFGALSTSIGLSEDLQKGLLERFRTLPMSRAAVLVGRTTADMLRNSLIVLIMTGIGYLVGFRVQTGVGGYLAGAALIILFSYALSWGMAFIGLSAPNAETANVMSFPVIFPLTFASGAFVPVATMPGWLQAFARYQPVTVAVEGARDLFTRAPAGGGHAASTHAAVERFMSLSSQGQHTLETIAWCAGLLLVLVPLAAWRYRRRV